MCLRHVSYPLFWIRLTSWSVGFRNQMICERRSLFWSRLNIIRLEVDPKVYEMIGVDSSWCASCGVQWEISALVTLSDGNPWVTGHICAANAESFPVYWRHYSTWWFTSTTFGISMTYPNFHHTWGSKCHINHPFEVFLMTHECFVLSSFGMKSLTH